MHVYHTDNNLILQTYNVLIINNIIKEILVYKFQIYIIIHYNKFNLHT